MINRGRVYEGKRVDGKPVVLVHGSSGAQRRLEPGPSQKVYNHSPDGFEWGYAGSGPAQLALAILLGVGLPQDRAMTLHQDFKRSYLALADSAAFALDETTILMWLAEMGVPHGA